MKNKCFKYILISILLLFVLCEFLTILNYKTTKTIKNSDKYDYSDAENLYIKNKELIQPILSKDKKLSCIRIFLDPLEGRYDNELFTDASLEISLLDKNKKIIETHRYEKIYFNEATNERYLDFKFKPIKNSKNKYYFLKIKSYFQNEKFSIKIANRLDETQKLTINGIENSKSLIYINIYKNSNGIVYVFYFIFILFMLILLILILNRTKKIETKYVILSIFLSFIIIINSPIGEGADEVYHYIRIYDLSNGKIVSETIKGWPISKIPNDIVSKKILYNTSIEMKMNSNNDDNKSIDMAFTSVYSIFSYVPHTIGLCLLRFIGVKSLWPFLIRMIQAICSFICVYYAIKIIPFGKNTLLLVGLLPSTLRAFCLITADSTLIAAFILFIAKVLQLAYSKNKIGKGDYFVLFFTSILVALSKLVYLPLCLLIILIPFHRKNITKREIFNLVAIFVVSLIITIVWNYIATINLKYGQGVNAQWNIYYYISNPIEFFTIVIHTFLASVGNFSSDVFGGLNFWFGTFISDSTIVPFMFMILFIFLLLNEENKLEKRDKVLVSGLLILTYILISIALLLACTPPYNDIIIGIQGRYFIVFLPCLYLIFSNNKKKKEKINTTQLIYIIIFVYAFYIIRCFI